LGDQSVQVSYELNRQLGSLKGMSYQVIVGIGMSDIVQIVAIQKLIEKIRGDDRQGWNVDFKIGRKLGIQAG
jgi:hypothetical protein